MRDSTAEFMNELSRELSGHPGAGEQRFLADMQRIFCPNAPPMPNAPEPMTRQQQADRAARHD